MASAKKSSLFGKASIADGIPPATKTGEPVPLFELICSLQEKGWRQTASQFTSAWQSRPNNRIMRILQIGVKIRNEEKTWGQKNEKSFDNAYIQGGVNGVKEDFYRIIHQLSCK